MRYNFFTTDNCTSQKPFSSLVQVLLIDKNFKKLSCEAKILYCLLANRVNLSISNIENWNDNGVVYVYFTLKEAMEELHVGQEKATKVFAELEKENLIKRKLQGRGKPAKIFVVNVAASITAKSKIKTLENQESKQRDTAKSSVKTLEKQDSGITKTETLDSRNPRPMYNDVYTDEIGVNQSVIDDDYSDCDSADNFSDFGSDRKASANTDLSNAQNKGCTFDGLTGVVNDIISHTPQNINTVQDLVCAVTIGVVQSLQHIGIVPSHCVGTESSVNSSVGECGGALYPSYDGYSDFGGQPSTYIPQKEDNGTYACTADYAEDKPHTYADDSKFAAKQEPRKRTEKLASRATPTRGNKRRSNKDKLPESKKPQSSKEYDNLYQQQKTLVEEQISYDEFKIRSTALLSKSELEGFSVDLIVKIIADVYYDVALKVKTTIAILEDDVPVAAIGKQFERLNADIVMYALEKVYDNVKKRKKKIREPETYFRSCLYTAPAEYREYLNSQHNCQIGSSDNRQVQRVNNQRSCVKSNAFTIHMQSKGYNQSCLCEDAEKFASARAEAEFAKL